MPLSLAFSRLSGFDFDLHCYLRPRLHMHISTCIISTCIVSTCIYSRALSPHAYLHMHCLHLHIFTCIVSNLHIFTHAYLPMPQAVIPCSGPPFSHCFCVASPELLLPRNTRYSAEDKDELLVVTTVTVHRHLPPLGGPAALTGPMSPGRAPFGSQSLGSLTTAIANANANANANLEQGRSGYGAGAGAAKERAIGELVARITGNNLLDKSNHVPKRGTERRNDEKNGKAKKQAKKKKGEYNYVTLGEVERLVRTNTPTKPKDIYCWAVVASCSRPRQTASSSNDWFPLPPRSLPSPPPCPSLPLAAPSLLLILPFPPHE